MTGSGVVICRISLYNIRYNRLPTVLLKLLLEPQLLRSTLNVCADGVGESCLVRLPTGAIRGQFRELEGIVLVITRGGRLEPDASSCGTVFVAIY